MIKVGIFWVVGGKVFAYAEDRTGEILSERERLSGKIDSDLEHFAAWDTELVGMFPRADFATYPRGRVMFDVKENRHVIYADTCVTENNIDEIKSIFAIAGYTIERDDHYRCDRCMRHVPRDTEKDKITYKIIDGADKIGANLIELRRGSTEILIECGKELEPTEAGAALREKIVKKRYDACFVSHCHADHAGLLGEPVNCDKIYMGEYTLKILKAIGGICSENADKTVTFSDGREIELGGLTVTPYLCDHSAYDSYMLLFGSGKNTVLYTGDFRANGRKSFDALLSRLPHEVDTIICEGTNLSSDRPAMTERELENALVGVLGGTDKPVFVLQSATNIDRIVSVYRAAIRSNRVFVMRLVQADICAELPNIPQPVGFKKCFVYSEFPLSDDRYKAYAERYGRRFIGREAISKMSDYVLEVTSKDLHYLEKLAELVDLNGAKLIYSTWSGYKEREDMRVFLAGARALGIEVVDLHASGHADTRAIGRLLKSVNHRSCIFVHTDKNKA